MNKPRAFQDEEEYRFAFSLKADAFRLENVDMKITTGPTPKIPSADYPEMLLKPNPGQRTPKLLADDTFGFLDPTGIRG